MNKKLSVLRRITAVVLCVTLLSSQVVVANAEDSERMNVQTNSENADISEQDGFSSDTSEISDITESDIPDSFEGESEPNTDISSEVTEEFGNSKDQGFTDGEETIIEDENTSDTLKKQIQIMKMEKYVSTITSNFCKSVQEHRCFPETKMEMLVKGIRFLQMVQNLSMHQTLPIV